MSQISSGAPSSGPGSGTVTSILFNGGLTATPNPITTVGTATLDQSALTTVDGTVYWTGTGATGKLNTTATGTANFVLTSNGAGLPPSYQAVSASGAVTSVSGGNNITITGTATAPIVNVSGTTNHAVQVGNATGSLTSVAVGTTGQVLTGVTGSDPVFAAPAASSITITGDTGGGLTGNSFTFTGGLTGLVFNGAGTTETLAGTLVIANGGTNATSFATTDGTIFFDGTRLVTTATGSANQVLTSNGAGVAPTYQSIPGTFGNSFPTDSGTATPSAGVLNIITNVATRLAGSTVRFTGTGNTVTLGVTDINGNVCIGFQSGNTNTGFVNTGLGYNSLTALTSGSFNTALGQAAGSTYTAEGNNIVIGNVGTGGDSGVIRIGTSGTQTTAFMSGIASVAVSNLNIVTINTATGQLGSASASSVSSISITGDTGGALVSNAFTFTGGTTGLTFSGAGTTETLTGTLIVANGGTGRTTLTNHGILVGAGTTAITQLAAATNGQLPIGSTGADPVIAALTAGAGISVTNGAGSITIAAIGTSSTWSTITANQTAAVDNGYFINKAGTLALLLPAASAVGSIIEVNNINTTTGTQITQAAGQQIFIGNTSTTLGAGGSLTSTALGDTLRLVCSTANLTWRTQSLVGNWTVV